MIATYRNHTVLVTGSGGFVGHNLCPVLSEAGWQVRRAIRHAPTGSDALSIGDISASTDWSTALEGVDAVVHLAARVHVLREQRREVPLERFRQVNVQATKALARQAIRAGVKRFVFLSTIGVHGVKTVGRGFRESDTPAPTNDYALSKLEAEDALPELVAGTEMELVILRPPLVYGPGVKANFLTLLRAVDGGWPLPLASLRNCRDLLYVGNLADVIRICLEDARAAGQTFLVADGEPMSTPELLCHVAQGLRVPCRLWPCPPWLLKLGGTLTGRSDMIYRLTGSLEVDISKLREVLDWQPPYSFDAGMEETVRWYREG